MTARIAVLADLGQDVYHAGDEAMGHAAADELSARGFQLLLLSRNPVQTERTFGLPAAATLAFPWPPAEREAYLEQIRAHLSGASELPADDPARALIRELSACDGVLVAGGGNLNSRFGWLLYERAAVVAVARALGKPVVVSGQTIGPQLTAPDAIVLADMLESAALNSMREPVSLQLASSLGVPAVAGLDDASFFSESSGVGPRSAELVPANGYVAVTVSPHFGGPDDFHRRIGAALDALHRQTGLPAVFVPHMGIGAEDGWDAESHARIAAGMSSPVQQLPVLSARDAAGVTARAAMVFTSRYHPAVFALSAGVPVVGVTVDTYSGVRLEGAMGNWGLADFVLPLPALQEGLLASALEEAWARRTDITKHLAAVRPTRADWASSWWDAVASVFGARLSPGTPAGLPPSPRFSAAGEWAARAGRAAPGFYAHSRLEAQLAAEQDRIRSYTEQQGRELAELQAEHQRLLASKTVKGALSLHRAYTKLFRR